MSLKAALSSSILELLQALNEKLGLECARTQEIHLPPVLSSVISLEAEVSSPNSDPSKRGI